MVLRVAIIGSGPSGFYTTNALKKRVPEAEVDIIERLPTPYGGGPGHALETRRAA